MVTAIKIEFPLGDTYKFDLWMFNGIDREPFAAIEVSDCLKVYNMGSTYRQSFCASCVLSSPLASMVGKAFQGVWSLLRPTFYSGNSPMFQIPKLGTTPMHA